MIIADGVKFERDQSVNIEPAKETTMLFARAAKSMRRSRTSYNKNKNKAPCDQMMRCLYQLHILHNQRRLNSYW